MNRNHTQVARSISDILDGLHSDLITVQAAVSSPESECVEAHIEEMQKLDHITQTVEAIATCLRNIETHADKNGNISVEALCHDVKLDRVCAKLKGLDAAERSSDIELF